MLVNMSPSLSFIANPWEVTCARHILTLFAERMFVVLVLKQYTFCCPLYSFCDVSDVV
jgi:hypothetical protein